ncbi:O-antigen ligase family protein [Paenibacillus koleovorans]|uniref:O-antigen ligase family protein n=1 Tax=Paenibacillus koleovorans TaxID=121608 RepID=UPI000FD85131|nr:O-antigen ligase family protein [Paenibacillus koleovorans]
MDTMPTLHRKLVHIAVFGYIVCLPAQFDFGGAFRLAPSDLFLLLGLLAAGLRLRLDRRQFSSWHWGMLLLFVFASSVSMLRNGFLPKYALVQKDIGFVLLLLTYILLVQSTVSWERMYKLLRAFLISVLCMNAIALFAFFSGVKIPFMMQDGRLSGMLIDPNAYGGLLVTAFALHIITSGGPEPLLRGWISAIATLSLSGGILMTFSRSSWIGLALVLAALAVTKRKQLLKVVGGFAAAFAGLLLYKGTEYLNVFATMASRPSQIQSRLDILTKAFDWIAQSPIVGIGLGTYNYELRIIIHNTPMWFMTEFGLLGLLVYCGFIAWFFFVGIRSYRAADPKYKPIILGLLLGHAAMIGLSMGIEALYQRYWWFLMAMNAACLKLTIPNSPKEVSHGTNEKRICDVVSSGNLNPGPGSSTSTSSRTGSG